MKPFINENGITIQSFEDIYNERADSLKAIYGENINLESSTPDGQRVGIDAKLSLDLQTAVMALYNQLDPDFSYGEALNMIIKFCGITRKPARRSNIDVIITTRHDLELPKNYIVQDENNRNWITTSRYNLKKGNNTVTLHSEMWGDITAEANTINKPVTIVLGVDSVTNPDPIEENRIGGDEETDEELRIRRNKSLEHPAYSTIGSLYARLANIKDVKDLVIYENSSRQRDEELDLDGNSYWIIIDGGDRAEIAKQIAINKTGGTGLKGNADNKQTYLEEFIRPDGSIFAYLHEVVFDKPTKTDLYISFKVQSKNKNSIVNKDAIKEALIEKTYAIAESIAVTDLYHIIRSGGDNFTASELKIGRTKNDDERDYLKAGWDEIFIIRKDLISIDGD